MELDIKTFPRTEQELYDILREDHQKVYNLMVVGPVRSLNRKIDHACEQYNHIVRNYPYKVYGMGYHDWLRQSHYTRITWYIYQHAMRHARHVEDELNIAAEAELAYMHDIRDNEPRECED